MSISFITEKYRLKIKDNEKCTIELLPEEDLKVDALKQERRKLYIVHNGNEILYVGEANTSIKTRFQRSLRSHNYFVVNQKRQGYAYKWLDIVNKARELTVTVIIFDDNLDDNRSFVEAIEGDLVFIIRKEFGYWPKFQNEIHFSNEKDAEHIAITIFEKFRQENITSINSEQEYKEALKRLEQIFDAAKDSKDGNELKVLGALVENYENEIIVFNTF